MMNHDPLEQSHKSPLPMNTSLGALNRPPFMEIIEN